MTLYRLELGFDVSNPGEQLNGTYQLDSELYLDASNQATTFLADHFEADDQFYFRIFRSGSSTDTPGDLGFEFTPKTAGVAAGSPIKGEEQNSSFQLPVVAAGDVQSSLFGQSLPCWVLQGGSGTVGKKLTLAASAREVKWAVNFQITAGGLTFGLDPEMIIDPHLL